MIVMIVGGYRHSEWVDVLDGSGAWVDIRKGDTYRIRKLNWGITRIGAGGMELTGESYKLALAVHPDLTTVDEQAVVTQLIQMLAMNEFIRTHGTLEVPDVPDTPAALLGPDGDLL